MNDNRREDRLSPTLRAVSDAVLAVAAELSVEEVLQRLVDSARELAGRALRRARHARRRGRLPRFLTSGMSDELIAALGPLPRRTACSARCSRRRDAVSRRPTSTTHPRFRGWWPRGHPDMRSFLGVPIVAPRRRDRRLLPDREGRRARVHRRGPGADRAARRPRRDRDHERPALRAQPRALDRRRAQPARARAARRGQPEAVRPRAHRRGGGDAARPRSGGGARAASASCRSWRRRRSRSCAR